MYFCGKSMQKATFIFKKRIEKKTVYNDSKTFYQANLLLNQR